MQIVIAIVILIGSYLVGAIPFGLIYVRLKTGRDVRQVESGRTGGTNAMRAAGFWVGFATAISDLLKAACAAWSRAAATVASLATSWVLKCAIRTLE